MLQVELVIGLHLILLLGIYCKVIYLSNVFDYKQVYKDGAPIASNGLKCLFFRIFFGYAVSLFCWMFFWLIFGSLFTILIAALFIFYQMIFLVIKRTNGEYLSLAALGGYYREGIHFKFGGIYKKNDLILLSDFSGLLLPYALSADPTLAYLHCVMGFLLMGFLVCFATYKTLLPSQLIKRLSFASLAGCAHDIFIAVYGILFFQIWVHYNERLNPVTHSSLKKFSFAKKNKPPGILLIEYESLDANIIGLSEKSSLICPTLTKLRNECLYFPYSLALTGSTPSADAYVSQYNSVCPPLIYPLTVRDNYYFPYSIISELGRGGYDSSAIFGFSSGFSCTIRAFQRMGFKKILNGKNTESLKSKNNETFIEDEALYAVAMEQFNNSQMPLFCHLSTSTTHSPWKSGRIKGEDNSPRNCYLRCLRKSDNALGEFLNNFRNQYPEVYIIIIGDHGPAVSSNEMPLSRTRLFSRIIDFVPLMIIQPNGQNHWEKSLATSCFDIVPTIANMAGGNYYLSTDGQTLISNSLNDSEIDIYGKKITRADLFQIAEQSKLRGERLADKNKNSFEYTMTNFCDRV